MSVFIPWSGTNVPLFSWHFKFSIPMMGAHTNTTIFKLVSLELKWYSVETASLAEFYGTSVKLYVSTGYHFG